MMNDIDSAIKELTSKLRNDCKSDEAMRFSQAILNLVNARGRAQEFTDGLDTAIKIARNCVGHGPQTKGREMFDCGVEAVIDALAAKKENRV